VRGGEGAPSASPFARVAALNAQAGIRG